MSKKLYKNKVFIASFIILLVFILIFIFIGIKSTSSPQLETVYLNASWAKSYSSINNLCVESDIVAIVKITGVNKQYTIMSGVPMTDFNAEVIIPIYGAEENDTIIIAQTGQVQGNQKFEIREDPLMETDNEYLIFGRKNELGTITILGGPQGRFSYTNGQINNLFVSVPELRNSSNNIVNFLEPGINFVNTDVSEIITAVENYFNES